MQGERVERRLAAIFAADVAGYSRLMGQDETGSLARLEALAEPGGICISRVVRDQVRDKLDLALEDLGEQSLKNIARPVRVFRVHPDGAPTARHPDIVAPEKPSIAVLPFENMSGDPEQDYFADGMVEDIITGLSHIKWLFVIARNSTFVYKGKTIDVKHIGRELGVRASVVQHGEAAT